MFSILHLAKYLSSKNMSSLLRVSEASYLCDSTVCLSVADGFDDDISSIKLKIDSVIKNHNNETKNMTFLTTMGKFKSCWR